MFLPLLACFHAAAFPTTVAGSPASFRRMTAATGSLLVLLESVERIATGKCVKQVTTKFGDDAIIYTLL